MRKSAPLFCALLLSLSARRAWIEICCPCRAFWLLAVALRKESVDRNYAVQIVIVVMHVALRKESVDRNLTWHVMSEDVSCRSPQGERG